MEKEQNKTVKIMTVPGMNIIAPSSCNSCNHLTERRMCSIWAFPETKWTVEKKCPDYNPDRLLQ